MGVAEFLAKNMINMDEQLEVYNKIKLLKNPKKKELIKQEMICMICCESKPLKEIMKCCNNKDISFFYFWFFLFVPFCFILEYL